MSDTEHVQALYRNMRGLNDSNEKLRNQIKEMTRERDDLAQRVWRDLCEKTDRTSSPEYPDMVLITFDELSAALKGEI